MPSILKRFMKPVAEDYVLTPAEELKVAPPPSKSKAPPQEEKEDEARLTEEGSAQQTAPLRQEIPASPIDYAEVQAEAILEDARIEAKKERDAAWEKFQRELEEERSAARQEGYNMGYAEGMASAMAEGKAELERMAADQAHAVEVFLEAAAVARDRLLDESREELKELALAIAEKVIRVSLRSSGDILRRMVEAATEKKKRCEWARIYIADCDAKACADTIPELTAALRGIAGRVRVIPMADDESGTCIIEMPDEILDASVSTQLTNIRETLLNASLDGDSE